MTARHRPARHPTTGFDAVPDRPVLVTAALFVVVVVLATVTAVVFKESAYWVVERVTGERQPVAAARSMHPVTRGVGVAVVLLVAGWLGQFASRRWPGRAGLEAVSACARGETRRISLRATLVRALGAWFALVGLAPLGRESAIIETGGAIGSTVARRFRGSGATMATAGIAAAFATAYHGPALPRLPRGA